MDEPQKVELKEVEAPKEVETVWAMFIPNQTFAHLKVKKI